MRRSHATGRPRSAGLSVSSGSCGASRQGAEAVAGLLAPLTWISQTYRCIGAENLRKMLCCNSFSEVQESPDADRVYAEAV
jgi:hypothetical protein